MSEIKDAGELSTTPQLNVTTTQAMAISNPSKSPQIVPAPNHSAVGEDLNIDETLTVAEVTCKIKLTGLLMTAIGYEFKSTNSLSQALTHKSRANELNAGPTQNSDNERLEFLGDAVLDLAMTDCLMRRFPNDTEGSLSKKRASLVNEDSLAQLATALKLDKLIMLGKGELKTGGLQKPRILASALEAMFGAIFNESGFTSALASIETLFAEKLEDLKSSAVDFKSDFKTRLQETAQLVHKATPTYQVNGEKGPDHDKLFEVSVILDGRILARGLGKSKKTAEQDAARVALETEFAAHSSGAIATAGITETAAAAKTTADLSGES